VAWKEHRVQTLCDMMAGVVSATVKHAEKQQTRTAEEREAEVREEEFGLLPDVGAADKSAKKHGHNDDDDEDAPVYNPLNLPLGWDGKPIPYWMYKLHGLGVEYKCQICGDQSYWGRRAFDRHFQEWKHAHGMRSLGIPNTKHFHDITQIEDAKALYNKIKSEISVGQFQNDMEEEFEDTHGNVLNRRTYEDLARQGLL
jgi:splicing factor 3A subunit 3